MDAKEQLKIFVCWSGERGRGFAEACQKWLSELFVGRVNVLISVEIEKGTVWFDELTESLRGARLGIICLTPEAIDSPWIHFEAGMLAKVLHEDQAPSPVQGATRSRILPFVLGVESALAGPLGAYQGTSARDKNDAWRLIETVAAVMPPMDPEEAKELRKRFRSAWDRFQQDLKAIKPVELRKVLPEFEHWFDRKTFNESMYDCLSQGWLARYNAAIELEARLRSNQRIVRTACGRFVGDVFDAVVFELNGYAMGLSKLIGQRDVPLKDGKLVFGEDGIAEACERLRKRIRALVARLELDSPHPFFEEAFRFELGETLEEKKRLINRRLAEIRLRGDAFTAEMNATIGAGFKNPARKDICRVCEWPFDRIVYYTWLEETAQDVEPDMMIESVRFEIERACVDTADEHLIALEYSLRQLAASMLPAGRVVTNEADARRMLDDLDRLLRPKNAQQTNHLHLLISEIRGRLPQPAAQAQPPAGASAGAK